MLTHVVVDVVLACFVLSWAKLILASSSFFFFCVVVVQIIHSQKKKRMFGNL